MEASHPRDAVKLWSERLPVLGQAIPGEHTRFVMNRQTIDEVMCPPGLENVPEAYAVFVLNQWSHGIRPARSYMFIPISRAEKATT